MTLGPLPDAATDLLDTLRRYGAGVGPRRL